MERIHRIFLRAAASSVSSSSGGYWFKGRAGGPACDSASEVIPSRSISAGAGML
jgi:hypothetical protein